MTTIGDAIASVTRLERKGDDKLMIFGDDALGDAVVGKTTIDNDAAEGASEVAYEAAIYTQIINPMMADEQCANLVTSVAWVPSQPITQYYFDVIDLLRGSNSTFTDQYITELRDYKDAVEDQEGAAVNGENSVSTLVTVVPPNFGGSVWDQFDNLRDDWRLPFQMAYTLAACELNGLSHNDNHLSNWLVSLGMPPVYYAVSASQFVPVAGLRIWLYDWDLGYAEALGPNPGLDRGRCRQLGMCNAVSGLHDLAQMACSLDWFGPGDACSSDSSDFMWERLRRAVCARSPDFKERAGICHIDVESLEWPVGISNAIEYVLQLPEVAAQVTDVATMDRDVARQLLNGDLPWVAHAGIDRAALMTSLRNRLAGSRKRPRVPEEARSVALAPSNTTDESMAVETAFPWASQGPPKIARVGV